LKSNQEKECHKIIDIPSNPQNEGSKNLEGNRVRRETDRLGKRIAVGIIETSNTRTQNLGGDESGDSTSHVNHTRSSEIVHTAPKEGVGIEGSDPSRRRPNGVYNNRVYKTREHETVGEVGFELATFGNGTSNCSKG
jgi:hypothetical protein